MESERKHIHQNFRSYKLQDGSGEEELLRLREEVKRGAIKISKLRGEKQLLQSALKETLQKRGALYEELATLQKQVKSSLSIHNTLAIEETKTTEVIKLIIKKAKKNKKIYSMFKDSVDNNFEHNLQGSVHQMLKFTEALVDYTSSCLYEEDYRLVQLTKDVDESINRSKELLANNKTQIFKRVKQKYTPSFDSFELSEVEDIPDSTNYSKSTRTPQLRRTNTRVNVVKDKRKPNIVIAVPSKANILNKMKSFPN